MATATVGSPRIAAPRLSLPEAGGAPLELRTPATTAPAAAMEPSGGRGLFSVDTGRGRWREGVAKLFGTSSRLTHGGTGVISDQWVRLANHEKPLVHLRRDDITLALRGLSRVNEACRLARANASGRIYLVGSQLYRTIIGLLYDREVEARSDFDFLVDRLTWRPQVPQDLMVSRTVYVDGLTYGEPSRHKQIAVNPFQLREQRNYRTFASDGFIVDLFSMSAFPSVPRTPQGPLFDYLTSVPLALQMLAYDIERGELVGAPGLPPGLLTGAMHINNGAELRRAAERSSVTIARFLEGKNRGLDFSLDETLRAL